MLPPREYTPQNQGTTRPPSPKMKAFLWSSPPSLNKPLRNAVHIAADASFKDAIVKFKSATCPPPTGYALNLLPWICWAIWIARNSLIFEDRVFSPEETYLKGLRLAKDNLQKQAASPSVNQELRIPREQSHSKRMQQRKEPTRSPA